MLNHVKGTIIMYINFVGRFIGENKILPQNQVDRNHCLDIFKHDYSLISGTMDSISWLFLFTLPQRLLQWRAKVLHIFLEKTVENVEIVDNSGSLDKYGLLPITVVQRIII